MFFQQRICQLQNYVMNSLQHSGEDWGWRLVCIAGLQLCIPLWGAVCAGTDESFWFSMFSVSSARLHWLSSSKSSTSGKEIGHLSNCLQQGCSSPCLAERQCVRSRSLFLVYQCTVSQGVPYVTFFLWTCDKGWDHPFPTMQPTHTWSPAGPHLSMSCRWAAKARNALFCGKTAPDKKILAKKGVTLSFTQSAVILFLSHLHKCC